MTAPRVDLPFQELDQRRAFEKILGQIEEAIVQGRLQSGDRLPSERELAGSFGASRGAGGVWGAGGGKRAAAGAGAEDTAQRRAMGGAIPGADDIAEHNRLDTEFHIELARASGSVLLPVLMEALRATVKRLMLETLASLDDWMDARDRLVIEHTEIIDAVAARQPDVAAVAVRDHVLRFYARATGAADQPNPPLTPANHPLPNAPP